MRHRRTAAVAALAVALAAAAGCTRQDEAGHGAVLVWRMSKDPTTLDPALAGGSRTQAVVRRTHEGLVVPDPDTGRPAPGLAERWEISGDGRLYTFHLRQGVTFHDGRPLTADDAAYTLRRLLDPDSRSLMRAQLRDIAGAAELAAGEAEDVTGIRVLDQDTLSIELVRPFAPLLGVLSMAQAGIVPAGSTPGERGLLPGTGAFRFGAWADGQHLDLLAFDAYRDGPPRLGRLRFLFVRDASTSVEQFLAGELHVLDGLPSGRRVAFAADRPGALRTAQLAGLVALAINHSQEPLGGNARLRRALAHALDRAFICRELNEGKDRPASQFLPPELPGHDRSLEGFAYDPAEAARLLGEAGYPGGEGLPPLRVIYPSADTHGHRILERLKADLAGLGIELLIDGMDYAAYMERLETPTDERRPFHLFRLSWDADYPDPDALFTPILHSASIGLAGSGNVSFRDQTLDLLLDQARAETDPRRRAALYRKASHRVEETVGIIPLYWKGDDVVVHASVDGIVLGPLGETVIPLHGVTLDAATIR